MSDKCNVKFRYRIVVNDDTNFPFRIQRKSLFFWYSVDKCRNIEEARDELKKAAKLEMLRPGSVVCEYTEQDFLVDKLKGTADTTQGVERFRF